MQESMQEAVARPVGIGACIGTGGGFASSMLKNLIP